MKFIRVFTLYIFAILLPVTTVLAKKKPPNKEIERDINSDNAKEKTLLSRLYGSLDLFKWRPNFRAYTCTVPAVVTSKDLPFVALNGMASSMTAVLVGYGPNEGPEKLRSNKGHVYGLGVEKHTRPKLSNKFTLNIDYSPPRVTAWDKEEFCILVFSPALKIGPTIGDTVGRKYNDYRRYLGSTENIIKTVIMESPSTNSKLLTECCFIMATGN